MLVVLVQGSDTEKELSVLKRKGNRVIESDPNEALPMTCPQMVKPSDNDDQRMILSRHCFFGSLTPNNLGRMRFFSYTT